MKTHLALCVLAVLAVVPPAWGQDTPRHGGELIVILPASDPPSYDAHREDTFAVLHPAAPHYSTLLKVDPTDPTATRLVGDLADAWSVYADGRVYTVSELTSRDVKASYDKIMNPPPDAAFITGQVIFVDGGMSVGV